MLTLLASLALLFQPEPMKEIIGPEASVTVVEVFGERSFRLDTELSAKPLAPCSTFKIWNTAIGLETGILKSPDEPFYKWDGQKRWLDAWNRDLTLKEAFAVSSVPAYQGLARKIGMERMKHWVDQLHYGDGNLSSGLEVFWLPHEGRETLLISADRQAELLKDLLMEKLPLSPRTVAVLQEVMQVKKTEKGALYGKTGSGMSGPGQPDIGWFVGFVETTEGSAVFAAVTETSAGGEKPLGPEMKERVIRWLEKCGVL